MFCPVSFCLFCFVLFCLIAANIYLSYFALSLTLTLFVYDNYRWDLLHKLSTERKPPIGYLAFARICLKYKQTDEALVYIDKVSSLEDRFDVLLEASNYRKAAEVAYKLKDGQRLEAVARLCQSDAQLSSTVQEMLSKV